jgi:NAD(P)-dependent dehydrogenase (short-subunit alcohol dehydrogenase family)
LSLAVETQHSVDRERHAGKAALITGAASGIGRAVATRLAREGALVACLDVNRSGAEKTADAIAGAENGGRAIAAGADVRNRHEVRAAVRQTVDAFGGLDLLVNAAGIITMTGFRELKDEEWDRVLEVNLKGYFIVAQEAAEFLTPGSSAIVNVSTVEADRIVSSSGHCQVHYNASKGGVRMLTKALAAELAADGVRVNAVAPGPVDTGLTGLDLHAPELFRFMSERLLIKRLAQPEDIAAAISFLLSDDAAYITGVELPVDGGWMVR